MYMQDCPGHSISFGYSQDNANNSRPTDIIYFGSKVAICIAWCYFPSGIEKYT